MFQNKLRRHHPTHAVPEQKARRVGVLLADVLGKAAQVVDELAEDSNVGALPLAAPMSAVVERVNCYLVLSQKLRKRRVPFGVFGVAVRDD